MVETNEMQHNRDVDTSKILARPQPHKTRRINRPIALTDDQIKSIYESFLSNYHRDFPFDAAYFNDLLHRGRFTFEREQQVRLEEEQRLQEKRRDIERSNEAISEKIAQLRTRILETHQKYEEQVAQWEQQLLEARAKERRLAAQCGLVQVVDIDKVKMSLDQPDGATPPNESVNATPNNDSQSAEEPIRPQGKLGSILGWFQRRQSLSSNSPDKSRQGQTTLPADANKQGEPSMLPNELVEPKPWDFEPDYEAALAVGRKKAPSIQALASRQGILSQSPAMEIMSGHRLKPGQEAGRGGLVWLSRCWAAFCNAVLGSCRWLITAAATVACGTVFGASLGILLGVLDMDQFTVAAQREIVALLPLAGIGIAIFWILGQTTRGIVSLWAEERYNSLLTLSDQADPKYTGNWLRISSIAVLVVSLLIFGTFIYLESSIERHGIVQFFQERMVDQAIATGKQLNIGGISSITAWSLALIACVPFLTWHVVEGWVHGRARAMQTFCADKRESISFQIADTVHAEHREMARAHHERKMAETARKNDKDACETEQANKEVVGNTNPPTPTNVGAMPMDKQHELAEVIHDPRAVAYDYPFARSTTTATLETHEENSENKKASETNDETGTQSDSRPQANYQPSPEELGEYLAARENCLTCYHRCERAKASLQRWRDATIQDYEKQIEILEQQRRNPQVALEQEAKARIDIAYRDYIAAVRACDRYIRSFGRYFCICLHGGLLRYLWHYVWCAPLPREHNVEEPVAIDVNGGAKGMLPPHT